METVKELREKNALSIRDLAHKSGVSPSTVERIESGLPVRPSTRRKIAKALHVKPLFIRWPSSLLTVPQTAGNTDEHSTSNLT